MICPRSHSQEAEKPSWNQGLTVPRSHIGMEWWEVSLRLESEAVDEVSAQHGLGVCPSRAAFPGSLTFQMPSDPLPCAPRIRYTVMACGPRAWFPPPPFLGTEPVPGPQCQVPPGGHNLLSCPGFPASHLPCPAHPRRGSHGRPPVTFPAHGSRPP